MGLAGEVVTDTPYDDDDSVEPFDDNLEWSDHESEDERRSLRGTSQCDGTCDPQCRWCLVSHECPNDCAGNVCPYESLAEQSKECGTLQEPLPMITHLHAINQHAMWQGAPWGCEWRVT
jgi:hypothetical protein